MDAKSTKRVAVPEHLEPMLRVVDVAAWLHMHPDTVVKFARTGQMPGHKVGKRWLFVTSEVVLWVSSVKLTK
jgi:excisionase family DNA binding protein